MIKILPGRPDNDLIVLSTNLLHKCNKNLQIEEGLDY